MRLCHLFRPLLAAAVVVASAPAGADTADLAELDRATGSGVAAGPAEARLLEEEDPLFGDGDDPLFDEGEGPVPAGRDPFEDLNRNVFGFNRSVDRWLFDPVTRGYRFVMPERGRRAVYRFSLNLDTPVVLANHMLQLRVVDSAGTLTRFVINTSLGVGGLFDPAESFFEVPRVDGDFGQTLARYGSPSGPFLMLPIFGPSTVRDVFGNVVDIVADPVSYLLGPFQWWTLALGGGEGLIVREASFDDYQQLEAGSIDFYAALRSAYLQTRDAAVAEARAHADATEYSVTLR